MELSLENHEKTLDPPNIIHIQLNSNTQLRIGDRVQYGLHGLCMITGIEQKTFGDTVVPILRLEIPRPPQFRNKSDTGVILVPLFLDRTPAVRLPLSRSEVPHVEAILSSRETYFEYEQRWSSLQTKLEQTVLREGAAGHAKVISFFFVLRKQKAILAPEVARFAEKAEKVFWREISEALGTSQKEAESWGQKLMRSKLLSA